MGNSNHKIFGLSINILKSDPAPPYDDDLIPDKVINNKFAVCVPVHVPSYYQKLHYTLEIKALVAIRDPMRPHWILEVLETLPVRLVVNIPDVDQWSVLGVFRINEFRERAQYSKMLIIKLTEPKWFAPRTLIITILRIEPWSDKSVFLSTFGRFKIMHTMFEIIMHIGDCPVILVRSGLPANLMMSRQARDYIISCTERKYMHQFTFTRKC